MSSDTSVSRSFLCSNISSNIGSRPKDKRLNGRGGLRRAFFGGRDLPPGLERVVSARPFRVVMDARLGGYTRVEDAREAPTKSHVSPSIQRTRSVSRSFSRRPTPSRASAASSALYMCVYMGVCVNLCVYVCICVYICIHTSGKLGPRPERARVSAEVACFRGGRGKRVRVKTPSI